jgi:hypothetical protein
MGLLPSVPTIATSVPALSSSSTTLPPVGATDSNASQVGMGCTAFPPLAFTPEFVAKRAALLSTGAIPVCPYLPNGESVPVWADYEVVVESNSSCIPFKLHRLSAEEWALLAPLSLGEKSDDVKVLKAIFSTIAMATGGSSGSRMLPDDAAKVLPHLRNWLHFWRSHLRNVDLHVRMLLDAEGRAASTVSAQTTLHLPPDMAAQTKLLAEGMLSLSHIGALMQKSAAGRTKFADRSIRFLIFAQGAYQWSSDFDPPPPLDALEDRVSKHVSGRGLSKERVYLLANMRHGWDPVWFHPHAASDLEKLVDALDVWATILLDIHGTAIAARARPFVLKVKAMKVLKWTPVEAYDWVKEAWAFFIDDMQEIFNDPVLSSPWRFPDGTEESKMALHERILPQFGEPRKIQAATSLSSALGTIAARIAAETFLGEMRKRVASSEGGEGGPPAKRSRSSKVQRDPPIPTRKTVKVSFGLFKAKYGTGVCFNHAVGIVCGNKGKPCDYKHDVILSEDERAALEEKEETGGSSPDRSEGPGSSR